ncbi:9330_t:CDS:1, partial [Gigaspora rosea]
MFGTIKLKLDSQIRKFNALKQTGISPKKLLFILTHLTTLAEVLAAQEY